MAHEDESKLFDDAHGAMQILMWQKDQKAVASTGHIGNSPPNAPPQWGVPTRDEAGC